MLGLTLARPAPLAPWPVDARFGIDFLTGRAMRDGSYLPLGQAMTFSRPSPRLAKTRTGGWRAFAPGEPAITDLGLSLEAESTNLIISNTANSGGGILLTGTTVSALGGNDSPARDAHGKRVVQGNGGTDSITRHSLNVIGGQVYSWSQSFKYDSSATWIRFTFSDNVAHGLNAWLNLQTMTLGLVGGFGSATMQSCVLTPEGDGWSRLQRKGSVPNNAAGALSTYAAAGNGSTIRMAGSFALWLPQMEIGAATSPIATSGMEVTRSADVANFLLPSGAQDLTINDGVSPSVLATSGGVQAMPFGITQWAWATSS